MVTLEPNTRENLRAVVALQPRYDQSNFVAPNAISIAEVYVEPTCTPLALVVDGHVSWNQLLTKF